MALHAIPAGATPQANPSPHAVPVAVSTLPPEEVQDVLSGIPLEDLSSVQLSELLSQLPGLGAVNTAKLQEALTKSIEGLAGSVASLRGHGHRVRMTLRLSFAPVSGHSSSTSAAVVFG